MDEFANEYKFDWSIQDGESVIISKDKILNIDEAVVLTSATGMIGSPIITEIGANVIALLNPLLLPNTAFRIESILADSQVKDLNTKRAKRTTAEGLYKIQEVKFKGDSREGDWIALLKGKTVLVIFPRGGGSSLTFPVKEGDECLLTFCERAIDDWHRTGNVSKPNARRFHSLSDATAFVGISSLANKIPSYDPNNTQLKADNGSSIITIQDNGILNFKSTTSVTIDSPDTIVTGNLDVQGDTTVTSNITSNTVNIGGTHKHTQAVDSAGDTQQDTGDPQ